MSSQTVGSPFSQTRFALFHLAIWLTIFVCGSSIAEARELRGIEASGGYMWFRLQEDNTFPKSWNAEIAAELSPAVRLVGEVSGSYKTRPELPPVGPPTLTGEASTKVHAFLAGPRFAMRRRVVTPFLQILAGATHISTTVDIVGLPASLEQSVEAEFGRSFTKFTIQPGAGFYLWLADRIGVRLGVNYRRLFLDENERGGENQLTVAAGVSFIMPRP